MVGDSRRERSQRQRGIPLHLYFQSPRPRFTAHPGLGQNAAFRPFMGPEFMELVISICFLKHPKNHLTNQNRSPFELQRSCFYPMLQDFHARSPSSVQQWTPKDNGTVIEELSRQYPHKRFLLENLKMAHGLKGQSAIAEKLPDHRIPMPSYT
jgi:hypothetical protein